MNKGRSFKEYMMIDLLTLSILGFGLEFFCLKVLGGFITLGLTISLIAVFRWNFKGLIPTFASGLAWVVVSLTNVDHKLAFSEFILIFLFSAISSLGVIIVMLMFKKINKKIIKKDFEVLSLYCIIGYIGQSLVRFIVAFFYENDFLEALQTGFVYNGVAIMGLVLAVVIVGISSRSESVLVEPLDYIKGLEEDRKRSYEMFEKFVFSDKEEKNEEEKEVDDDDRISN